MPVKQNRNPCAYNIVSLGTIKVYHVEPLSTLKADLQKEAAERVARSTEFGHTITLHTLIK
ncbi:MAG: hypothetical protein OEX77_09520 [Candidatus Bathyarchaeota archaeon]|nr:hypothetical protein [Candidatus Bathyarchaeota archaeon]